MHVNQCRWVLTTFTRSRSFGVSAQTPAKVIICNKVKDKAIEYAGDVGIFQPIRPILLHVSNLVKSSAEVPRYDQSNDDCHK